MAVDYFLKIDGIDGESTQTGHPKEIELHSFSWGESNSGTAASNTGAGSGKVNMSDFSFMMSMNRASPKLFLSCATGEHIKKATLTCRKAGGKQEEYLKIDFTEILISSYQTSGGGTEIPTDSISFNFGKIEVKYAPQKAEGGLEAYIPAGYDLTKGVKV